MIPDDGGDDWEGDTSGIRWDDDPEAMRSLKMGLVWLLLNVTIYGGS